MEAADCPPPTTEDAKPSSRSVANLSLDKLYRKRAIDRENQRELRKKNKARLNEMEAEVQRLAEKLRESETERVRLTNQTENHRRKIDSVMSILGSLQGGQLQSSSQYEAQHLLQMKSHSTPGLLESKGGASSLPSPGGELNHLQGLQCPPGPPFGFGDAELTPDLWSNGGFLTFALDGETPVGMHDFSLDLNSIGGNAFQSPFPNTYCPAESPVTGGPHTPHNPHTSPTEAHNHQAFVDARIEANRLRTNAPIWAIVPTFSPATCPVDALVIWLMEHRQKLFNQDGNHHEFTNANFPSVSSLLNPILYEPDKPVASTIARHVARVIRVHTTPEKIALLYTICLLIRWYICPVEENYDAIPEFMRPTASQLTVPHPVWIGTIGWPKAREALIRHFDLTVYQDFAREINGSFSINWPHQLNGILDGTPEKGFVLTRAFIEHLREPANWTVGQGLIDAFPFLKGTMNVK